MPIRYSCLAFLPLCGALFMNVAPPALGAEEAAATNTCRKISSENVRGLTPVKTETGTGKRVALVIGNSSYSNGIPSLKNPENDARAVTDTLSRLGFTIFQSIDGDASVISDCANRFAESVEDGDVALVYYSGHGIQIDDRNYIVAADAKPDSDVANGYIFVDEMIDRVKSKAATVLVFLDACRNNPFAPDGNQGLSVSTGRGLDRGLAKIESEGNTRAKQASGIFVAYSTSPNSVATDGIGKLSPFTEAFVKTIGLPGYSVQRALSEVTKSVGEATDWQQTPWTKSSLTGELKLNGALTLDEAISLSKNFAMKSTSLLQEGNVPDAIKEALRGIPKAYKPGAEKYFVAAYAALDTAMRSSNARLDVPTDPAPAFTSSTKVRRVASQPYERGSAAIQLWNLDTGTLLKSIGETSAGTYQQAPLFSPDGTNVLAETAPGSIIVVDAISGALKFNLQLPDGGIVLSYKFGADAKTLVAVSNYHEQLFHVIDLESGKLTHKFEINALVRSFPEAKGGFVNGFADVTGDGGNLIFHFSPSNVYENQPLAFGLIDLKTGEVSAGGTIVLTPSHSPYTPSAARNDGKRLLVGYIDKNGYSKTALLDPSTGKPVKVDLEGGIGEFSPDGKTIALFAYTDSHIRLYSSETGEPLSDTSEEFPIPGVFSPNGTKIAYYTSAFDSSGSFPLDMRWEPITAQALVEDAYQRLKKLSRFDGVHHLDFVNLSLP